VGQLKIVGRTCWFGGSWGTFSRLASIMLK